MLSRTTPLPRTAPLASPSTKSTTTGNRAPATAHPDVSDGDGDGVAEKTPVIDIKKQDNKLKMRRAFIKWRHDFTTITNDFHVKGSADADAGAGASAGNSTGKQRPGSPTSITELGKLPGSHDGQPVRPSIHRPMSPRTLESPKRPPSEDGSIGIESHGNMTDWSAIDEQLAMLYQLILSVDLKEKEIEDLTRSLFRTENSTGTFKEINGDIQFNYESEFFKKIQEYATNDHPVLQKLIMGNDPNDINNFIEDKVIKRYQDQYLEQNNNKEKANTKSCYDNKLYMAKNYKLKHTVLQAMRHAKKEKLKKIKTKAPGNQDAIQAQLDEEIKTLEIRMKENSITMFQSAIQVCEQKIDNPPKEKENPEDYIRKKRERIQDLKNKILSAQGVLEKMKKNDNSVHKEDRRYTEGIDFIKSPSTSRSPSRQTESPEPPGEDLVKEPLPPTPLPPLPKDNTEIENALKDYLNCFLNLSDPKINEQLDLDKEDSLNIMDYYYTQYTTLKPINPIKMKHRPEESGAKISEFEPTEAINAALGAQPKYKLINVQGDGNCFYRALYHAIKNDETQSRKINLNAISEEDFVAKIRQEASEAARTNQDKYFTDTINSLYVKSLTGKNPQEIINTIATDGKWKGLAGDAAVSIVQQYMKNQYDIEMDIFLPGQTDPLHRIGNGPCLFCSGDHYQVMVPAPTPEDMY